MEGVDRENEGNSTDEIEVTPEMIEAGAAAFERFEGYDPYFVVEKVFLAMLDHSSCEESRWRERERSAVDKAAE